MTPTAYAIATVAVMTFVAMSKRIEDLKEQLHQSSLTLVRLRGDSMPPAAETPCGDELALLSHPQHEATDTEEAS